MNDKLLPCPFCGGNAYEHMKEDNSGCQHFGVACEGCNVFVTEHRNYMEFAIEAWNKRHE